MKRVISRFYIFLPILIITLCTLFSLSAVFSSAETDENQPSVSIEKFNLSFSDSVYIKYAVALNGVDDASLDEDDFSVLFWTEPQSDYIKGTEAKCEVIKTYTYIDDVKYYVFAYKDLAAKQMTDVIYARACLEVDGEIFYSDVEKYSILEYAYTKLGKIDEGTNDEELKDLLSNMLLYGSYAQNYFNYKTERLATMDYYEVKVNEGRIISDYSTHGLYLVGEQVTIKARSVDNDMNPFNYWVDSEGNPVGFDEELTVSVEPKNEVYTPIYTPRATSSEYFTFTELEDGTYSIGAKDINNIPESIVLPSTHNGKAVTEITRLGFRNCNTLTDITIPNSVKKINSGAFYGCTILANLVIPESIILIGDSAFENDTSLLNVIFEGSVSDWCNITFESNYWSNPFYYATNVYIDGNLVEDLVIPSDVTRVCAYAFSGCKSLKSVTFEGKVNSIEKHSFSYTPNLRTVTLSEGAVSIDGASFYFASALEEVTVNESLGKIGEYAFYECTSIKKVVLPEDSTAIEKYAFYNCSELEYFNMPSAVTDIGAYSFYNCSKMLDVALPQGLETIGDYAFYRCYGLTNIIIPDSVTSIGAYSFCACNNVISLTIGSGITQIPRNAFTGLACDTITVPQKIKSIGDYAFSYTGATHITLPYGLETIGEYAFYKAYALESIVLPDSVTEVGKCAFMEVVTLKHAELSDGMSIIHQDTFHGCTALESVKIGSGIKTVVAQAFYKCSSLNKVYYKGTSDDFAALIPNISYNNTALTGAARYYYSASTPEAASRYWYYDNGVIRIWE